MRKWLPLVAICLGAFILLVDVTIVNVTLPSMASDLHASFASLQWVMDIYALALAALLMVTGSLADLVGYRRVYVVGLTVFAFASLAAALSPNAAALITARGRPGRGRGRDVRDLRGAGGRDLPGARPQYRVRRVGSGQRRRRRGRARYSAGSSPRVSAGRRSSW